jgi:hypothetical protein
MTPEPYDRSVVDALARLKQRVIVPPIDADRERALAAAFDAHRARPRRAIGQFGRLSWVATAVLVVVVAALNWVVVRRSPQSAIVEPPTGVDLTGFVAWPGSSAWPPFESGSIVRVEVPAAALPSRGEAAPAAFAQMVPADVVVGQEGLARAIRLVREP